MNVGTVFRDIMWKHLRDGVEIIGLFFFFLFLFFFFFFPERIDTILN